MSADARVDLMYLACNRFEFTRETFAALLENTNWAFVHELFVYDDGSVDGTREWLEAQVLRVPSSTRFVPTHFGSPVSAMVDFVRSARAPILAKVDNDAMMPPAWLDQSCDVMHRHPELSLLGIEAMYPHLDDPGVPRTFTRAQFISGLGLYRREAFARSAPAAYNKWFGLEEWQLYREPGLVRGWITPAIPVFLLDRIPFEPWTTYSDAYIARGWQRTWPKYDPSCTLWHWRWPESDRAQPAARVRFLCVMRVRNEESHIGEALSRALDICERALILDDHSSDRTVEICRSFGTRVEVIESPFETAPDEARDKNFLLPRIARVAPQWVLWIDGDEVLEKTSRESILKAVASHPDAGSFSLKVAYLWDQPSQVRVDGIFGTFRRPSLFRFDGQNVEALHFAATARGPNLHCGNVPRGIRGPAYNLDVRLKHYGYMLPEQRKAKYAWYTQIDAGNAAEDHYRHLADIPGARFAPGPPRFAPWSE